MVLFLFIFAFLQVFFFEKDAFLQVNAWLWFVKTVYALVGLPSFVHQIWSTGISHTISLLIGWPTNKNQFYATSFILY